MSATLLRPAPVTASAQLSAVWRAQSGALMLLGHVSGLFPKAGSARISTPTKNNFGSLGLFRAELWPATGGGQTFLAVIHFAGHADPAIASELVLRGARAADRDIHIHLLAPSSEADFGRAIAASAVRHAARLARFMLEFMRPDDDTDTTEVNTLFAAFLAAAGRRDGCVELILQVPGRCVILQGWGDILPVKTEIVSTVPFPSSHAAQPGKFTRTDVKAPAVGSVLALPEAVLDGIVGQKAIYLLAGDELVCRNIVESRVLDAPASIGQLRHLLPRLECPEPLAALLQSVLQPRFEGLDTLNTTPRPVRAALDVAVYADGAGIYLSGWLFDPAGHVTEVAICAGETSIRLDAAIVRTTREDVSAAFSADPAFPKPPCHRSGFAVNIIVELPSDASPHLRFTFRDGEFAFLPLSLASALPAETRHRLLSTVDLHKPSGIAIVERHLAPFFSRLSPLPQGAVHIAFAVTKLALNAIVVPLRAPKLPRALVASLLQDPPSADEIVVVVVGPEWDVAKLDALTALLRFYALPAMVLALSEQPNALSGLAAAAASTGCSNFLLLAPNVAGSSAGWRSALYEAEPDAALVCPTVLYEDGSVRFAGSVSVNRLDHAPFAQLGVRLAGLNSSYVTEGEPAALDGGILACCLVRRPAILALDPALRFLTAAGMEAAFFGTVARAGLLGKWIPPIRIIAPEDDEVAPPIASLVDGWMLRHEQGEQACGF